MIDSGFNRNFLQYTKEFGYLFSRSNDNKEERKAIDPNSFFGSFLSICKEKNNSFEKNPFFSEIKQNPIVNPPKQFSEMCNNYSSFFGAFNNQGTTFAYGIPSLKYRIDPFDISFESEYKKYLNQYSNYLYQSQLQNTNLKPEFDELFQLNPKDIFTQLYLNNSLCDPIYNTSQLIKSQEQFHNQGKDDFYSCNELDETGFINCYKIIHFEKSLQKSFNNLYYTLDSPIDQKEFYSDLVYLIQGISSNTFSTGNKFPFVFELQSPSCRLFGTLHALTKTFFEHFIRFGTKMQLIQYIIRSFLFNQSNILGNYHTNGNLIGFNLPLVLKRFYMMVHDILIQINEKIMHYKTQLENNKMTLISLRNKIKSLSHFINILYSIFNLEDKANMSYDNSLEFYFTFYINVNIYKQSHHLINSLINFHYSFHTQTKTYYLIKNLLLNSLHSYLFFIIVLMFNNNVIDENNEYFILKNKKESNAIALDNSKIPLFLEEYKSVMVNNAILLEMIKKYDESYFSVCNYKSNELIDYLDKLSLINSDTNIISDFIKFKDRIFNKKLELMYVVNEKIIAGMELKKNEERINRLNKIKLIKDTYRRIEEKEKKHLEEVKAKKLKYLNDIQNQIKNKKQRIEFELQKITNEQVEQREIEREKKRMQEEIIQKLKEKYDKIRESTKMIQLYGDERQQWKIKRHNNNLIRNDLFNAMHDRRGFDNIYPVIDINILNASRYHCLSSFPSLPIVNVNDQTINNNNVINLNDINITVTKSIEDKDTMIIDNDNYNIEKHSEIHKESEKTIEFPKFFIRNIIYNDILLPIIDTALDIANEKYETIIQANKGFKQKKYHFVSKNNKEVDMEVIEILNKIPLLLQEKQSEIMANYSHQQNNHKIEIPLQIIIQEFFYDIIIKQYKITNHSFVQMMKNKYHLLVYFDFFKEILLCHSGDLILKYIESIFDFRTLSFSSNDCNYLSSHLQAEITHKYSNRFPEYVELAKRINFSRTSQMNLNFSISNIDIAFKLLFKSEEPINLVYTNRLIEVYDTVFKQLLKQFAYNQIIVRTYSVLKNIRKEYRKKEDEALFKAIFKTFNECYVTLKAIHTFLYYNIIDFNWKKMRERTALSADIYEISNIHYDCIRSIAEVLIENPIIQKVNKLFHQCSRFYLKSIIADYFDFNTVKTDAIFLNIIDKMRKSNTLIIRYIKEERVIGEFYDLKNYF